MPPLSKCTLQARPLPPLDRVFQVHDSEAPLTVPMDPHLTTGSRAAERAAFDHAVEEKMRLMEVSVEDAGGHWGWLMGGSEWLGGCV